MVDHLNREEPSEAHINQELDSRELCTNIWTTFSNPSTSPLAGMRTTVMKTSLQHLKVSELYNYRKNKLTFVNSFDRFPNRI